MQKINSSPDSLVDSLTKKTSQRYEITTNTNVKKVPPDGGWGWMIVLGSFLGLILGTFPVFAFSILFSPILMTQEVSSVKITWIFNVHSLVWSLTTLFIGPLCDEFGWKKIAIFGGAANSLSVLLSAFAPYPDYLFFSFSLIGGVGGASALSLGFMAIAKYFNKYRGFALGITTLGSCISSFLAPIVANYLLEHYGYMGSSLIFGAIVLNQCVGGALYQPVEWHMKLEETDSSVENDKLIEGPKITNALNEVYVRNCSKDNRRISAISAHSIDSYCQSSFNLNALPNTLEEKNVDVEDISENFSKLKHVFKLTYNNIKSLKFMRVKLIGIGFCGLILGYINFQMWIPFVITNAGYSLEMAAWCSSIAAIGNVCGRIIMSVLSDRKFFNQRYGYMIGLLLTGSSIIAFSLVKDITFYMIATCGWGFGIGSAMALHITVMIKVMGVENLPAVLGVASLFRGFGGLPIGILVGVVRDATSSYAYALWMLGGCVFTSFVMWLLMPWGEKFDKRKYSKDEKKESSLTSPIRMQ